MRLERLSKPCLRVCFAVLAAGHLAALSLAAEPGGAQRGESDPAPSAERIAPAPSIDPLWTSAEPLNPVRPLPPTEVLDVPPLDVPMAPPRRPSLLECCDLDVLVRGYFVDDQRIQWTGQEATFGAEAVVAPVVRHCWDGWQTTMEGEFYLNQPFDRNILVDTPERASYRGNFEIETFEISKLFLSVRHGDLLLGVGKMATPFGRYYFPLFTNARIDAPFIRTESILWRETGLLVHYDPGCWELDAALTNGCEDRDTNSSKALVARVGIKHPCWAAGVSVKTQDGIGSESQKQFKNHVGADFMLCRGRWTLSGEVIGDEYGFRRPGFDPLDITWGRSIYYRDQNYRLNEPIRGVGYYVNFGYTTCRWATYLNYGEFYPQQLGDPRHDTPNRHGIVKIDYQVTDCVNLYTVVMAETEGFVAQDGRLRRGSVVLAGFQWTH